jgi:hypothetical protein
MPPTKLATQAAHIAALKAHGTYTNIDGVVVTIWGGSGGYTFGSTSRAFSEALRTQIDALGEADGCHTCGRYKGDRKPGDASHWVPDHQPPIGVAESLFPMLAADEAPFRLYPQCLECSFEQMGRSPRYVNAMRAALRADTDPAWNQHLTPDLFWGAGPRYARRIRMPLHRNAHLLLEGSASSMYYRDESTGKMKKRRGLGERIPGLTDPKAFKRGYKPY